MKIIIEARYTVTKLSIKDKIKELGDGGAYLIVKDHKEESAKKPLFRLMHPLKSEIRTIETKNIIDEFDKEVTQSIKLNQ